MFISWNVKINDEHIFFINDIDLKKMMTHDDLLEIHEYFLKENNIKIGFTFKRHIEEHIKIVGGVKVIMPLGLPIEESLIIYFVETGEILLQIPCYEANKNKFPEERLKNYIKEQIKNKIYEEYKL